MKRIYLTITSLIAPIAVFGLIASLAYAFTLKRRNRKKFDLIGRMIDEGEAIP